MCLIHVIVLNASKFASLKKKEVAAEIEQMSLRDDNSWEFKRKHILQTYTTTDKLVVPASIFRSNESS